MYTQEDITYRILLIVQKISELGNIYANDLKLGKSCEIKDRNRLILLEVYLELIRCIDAYNESDNCYTDKELEILFDRISVEYNICFNPPNTYEDFFRITEDGSIRELENGDLRIIE